MQPLEHASPAQPPCSPHPNPPVLLISSIWPTVAYDNYVKWRSAGLAFLQLFLFALPFNFDTAVVNAIAPAPGVGRAAWILDIFQVFMSESHPL